MFKKKQKKNTKYVSCCVRHHQDFCKLFLSPVTSLALRQSSKERRGNLLLTSQQKLPSAKSPQLSTGQTWGIQASIDLKPALIHFPLSAMILIQRFSLNFPSLSSIVGSNPLIPISSCATNAEIPYPHNSSALFLK